MAEKKDVKQATRRKKTSTAASRKKNTVSQRTTLKQRASEFLARRPHRSFRLSHRRDYIRTLSMPGYWEFTWVVVGVLRKRQRTFALFVGIMSVVSMLLVGLSSQETFSALRETLTGLIGEGDAGQFEQAGILALAVLTGGLGGELNEIQQVYSGSIVLMVWLTTIWLLRHYLAGHAVRLRDGIYNAGAPIVSTALLCIVLIAQLLPVALGFIGYSAAQASGLLEGGVEAMLFWMAAAGLATLSLYWLTGTLLALVIITLPGTYPLYALRVAGDLVVGRRLKILLRLLWLIVGVALTWLVVLIVGILIDMGVKQLIPAITWLPIVPFIMTVMTVAAVVWAAAYVYLFYRKVVDADADAV